MPETKAGLQVRVSDDVAYVSTTDVRTNFTAIYSKVLQKYDTVVIEKNGSPIAVLKRPEDAGPDMKVEEF
jgi:hypothetical protein